MAALLSGCAGTSHASSTNSSAPAVVVQVTITGHQVNPDGHTVHVPLGSSVELDIHADADGEIHVHSSPEQQISYHAGTTKTSLGNFMVPGQIVVESHSLNKTIVTLRVQ